MNKQLHTILEAILITFPDPEKLNSFIVMLESQLLALNEKRHNPRDFDQIITIQLLENYGIEEDSIEMKNIRTIIEMIKRQSSPE